MLEEFEKFNPNSHVLDTPEGRKSVFHNFLFKYCEGAFCGKLTRQKYFESDRFSEEDHCNFIHRAKETNGELIA